MIDVTKEIPIRQDFLDNVLDKKPIDEMSFEDYLDMDLDELTSLADHLGMDIEESTPPIDYSSKPWWIEVDEDGREIEKFEEGSDFNKIIVAPFYLVYYMVKSIERRTKEDLKNFSNNFMYVNVIFFVIGLIFTNLGFRFFIPFSKVVWVTIAGVIMSRVLFVYSIKGQDVTIDEAVEELDEVVDDEIVDDVELEEFDIEYKDEQNLTYDDEDMQILKMKKKYEAELPLVEKKVMTKDIDEFRNELIRGFKNSEKYRGKNIYKREDILLSLNEYILCNNPGFSDFRAIERGSIVYNNISYLIYQGVRDIYTRLTFTGEYTMEVESLYENLLYYKLKVRLPVLVKLETLIDKIDTIERRFKKHEADNEVDIKVTASGGVYTFWIMKPDNNILTLGDVLRYYDPTRDFKTYEDFVDDDKYELPILVGLQDEEVPYIFDMAKNTNIAIAGTSGSGKSWAVFSFMLNLVLQSHPGDVSFVIFDFKRDPLYTTFARLPHVVGFYNHENTMEYIDYIKEIQLEMARRKEILDSAGISKWSELRKGLRDRPEDLHKFPWLFVVLEETASVLNSLEAESKDKRDEFINNLVSIAKQARSFGIRLMLISQRTVSAELPKNVLSECGVRYAFQLKSDDTERMDMKPFGVMPPNKTGIALFKDENLTYPISVKTLGVGGLNDEQIISLVRILAYEWQLRVDYDEIKDNFPTLKLTNNLLERRIQVLNDYKEGRLFQEDVSKLDTDKILNNINKSFGVSEGNIEPEIIRKDVGIKATGNKDMGIKATGNKDIDVIVEDDTTELDLDDIVEGNVVSNWGIKVEQKDTKVNKDMFDDTNKDDFKEGKLDIQEFIRRTGKGVGGKVLKTEVERYYTKKEIREALNNIDIVEDGDYYRA